VSRAEPILVALALALAAAPSGADEPEPPRRGLTAKIVVRSKLPLETDRLEWELVPTNQSSKPVRVCTLCGGGGGAWEGHYEEYFAPDKWKSDRPRDEEFGRRVVTLKAGESVSLPASLGGYRGEQDTLTASYRVGKEFAARHKVWQGKAEAKLVVIRAVKPRKD
jgi:hypothetical protein